MKSAGSNGRARRGKGTTLAPTSNKAESVLFKEHHEKESNVSVQKRLGRSLQVFIKVNRLG